MNQVTRLSNRHRWEILPGIEIRVTTPDGLRYRFGLGYLDFFQSLACGMAAPQIEDGTKQQPRLRGLLLSLRELQLVEESTAPHGASILLTLEGEIAVEPAGESVVIPFVVLLLAALLTSAILLPRFAVLDCCAAMRGDVGGLFLVPLALFAFIYLHECCHAAAARVAAGSSGRIALFDGGIFRPRFVLDRRAAIDDMPNGSWVLIAGPWCDQLLTFALTMVAISTGNPWPALLAATMLLTVSANCGPSPNSDLARALARLKRLGTSRRAVRLIGFCLRPLQLVAVATGLFSTVALLGKHYLGA